MSKGEQTRELIVARSARLFNRQGFFGALLADIMRETGLEKGGIYNHFASKEALALEAFDYATKQVSQRMSAALAGKYHTAERLEALAEYFLDYLNGPGLDGGCPILNTAIEADDAYPVLRDRARQAMDRLQAMLVRIIQKGIERGELLPTAQPEVMATVYISSLEGALMMGKLYNGPLYLHRVIEHLNAYTRTFAVATDPEQAGAGK